MSESYRVKFRLSGSIYYTEWFETFDEAMGFVHSASHSSCVFALAIEDENGDIV